VVGWYNSAYKWVLAFNVIPSFFTIALFPVLSRQAQEAPDDARRTFRLAIKLMLLIALPLAVATTALAPLMIGVLGGREFLPAGAIALQILIWSIPIGWINSVTNYVLIAHGREKLLTVAFVVGVTFNVAANLILLPRFSYVAASAITILSELILLTLFAAFLRPAMPGVGWLSLMARPAGLAAAMALALIGGGQLHPLLGLALALAIYALGLWRLSILTPGERRILGTLLPQRLTARLPAIRPQPEG
jgi:O-antigen/teichoic acid export membrane protein